MDQSESRFCTALLIPACSRYSIKQHNYSLIRQESLPIHDSQRMLLILLYFIHAHKKASCAWVIRIVTANSDYRLHGYGDGILLRDRSGSFTQSFAGIWNRDDGFSIEPWTFNFARIFRMFCRSRNLFSPKMKHKFHAICIFIDTSDATPLPFPIVKAIFISAMMLDYSSCWILSSFFLLE